MKNIIQVIDTMREARAAGNVEVWKNWNSTTYVMEYSTPIRDIQVIVIRGQTGRQYIHVEENDLHKYIFDLVGSGYVLRIEQKLDPDPHEAWENTRVRLKKMVDGGWTGNGLIAKEDILPLMPQNILHRFEEAVCNYAVDYHYRGKIDFLVSLSSGIGMPPQYPVKGLSIWAEGYGDGDEEGEDVFGFDIYPETFWKDVERLEKFIADNASVDE